MKNTLYFIGLFLMFIVGFACNECTHDPLPEIPEPKKEAIKEEIAVKEKEVTKLKEEKGKIVYRAVFDTLATIDTLYIELIKCDSVVKIDNVIIADQDTIIAGKDSIIAICESDNTTLKRDIKKQKRKNLLTKIGAGVVIVAAILLAR
jgi:hypothetical protein